MPRFSWLFNATQAPSKNDKEKSRETKGEERELSTSTNQKDPRKFDSIEDLSKSDDPPSWLTWLRKAADLQRKSRQSFYIDPPVIDIWNSSSSSLTNDPVSRPELQRTSTEPSSPKKASRLKANQEPLYDPSLASEYNKAILSYISTGTVPKPKSSPSPKSKKSSKQEKTVHFELEATTKKEEKVPKLNMQSSRIIFQSPQLTVILTLPEGETQISRPLQRTGSKTLARYKSTKEREKGGEKRNPFLAIRNYRLGNGSMDRIHTTTTNTNGMTRTFPNRSSPNLSYPPFNPGDYHTFNPHLNTAQNPRFSTSYLHPTLSPYHVPIDISSRSNFANSTLLSPNLNAPTSRYDQTQRYNPHLLKPPPPTFVDARRIKRQNEQGELKEVREFMIEVLNREGGQLKKGIRWKIMGLYGIQPNDLEGGYGNNGQDMKGKEEGMVGGDERGEGGRERVEGGGAKKVDEGVDFGCEKEDLRSLEMMFRGRFSGSWDMGNGTGSRVSA